MYFVKYGESYLHDPRSYDNVLLDLSVTSEENSCGYCDFTIYPGNPMYSKLKERDLANPITVWDDDTLLFRGFIYELGTQFQLDGQIKCKGDLEILNDTIIRPYTTLEGERGAKAPNTPNEFFEWLIAQHNSQVEPEKQFVVGINQVNELDNNNYIYRSNSGYTKTLDEIKDKLINNENLGGYLRLRFQNGIRYIDYLSSWTESNAQVFDFGINLTDYMQTDDAGELATYVIPYGASMNETDYPYTTGYYQTSDVTPNPQKTYFTYNGDGTFTECDPMESFEPGVTYYEYDESQDESNDKLTISGVIPGIYEQQGFTIQNDIIYCDEAVNRYGMIGMPYSNGDITVKEHLYLKGILALKEKISPKRTIEIKAVDMHLINPEMRPVRVGEYVRVRSYPHNLDSYFLCRSIDLDLNNPENSLYTLGTSFDTLTGQQNKRIMELNSSINRSVEKIESGGGSTKIATEAKQEAVAAKTEASFAKSEADKANTNIGDMAQIVEMGYSSVAEALAGIGSGSGSKTTSIDVKSKITLTDSYNSVTINKAKLRRNGNVGELEIVMLYSGGFATGGDTPIAFYFDNTDKLLPSRTMNFVGSCHSDYRYPAWGNGYTCWWFFNCYNTTLTSIPVYIRPWTSCQVVKLFVTFLY